jgi:putative membrane protein
MSRRPLLGMALLSLAVVAATPAVAQQPWWWWGDERGLGHTMFGGLGMLLFWSVVVVLLVLLVRAVTGRPATGGAPSAGGRQSPLEILQERYARGEIDKNEYEERRKTLGV